MNNYCSFCGVKLDGKHNFCYRCGHQQALIGHRKPAQADVLPIYDEIDNLSDGETAAAPQRSIVPGLLLALIAMLCITFAVIFLNYNSNISKASGDGSTEMSRAASAAIDYIKSTRFTGSGFATEGLITDEITFGDIFNAEHFINTSWNCTLDKGTYTVSFSGVPLSDCDYHVTKISVDIETPVSLDGSVSVSFFSMELEDGSLHSFRIDDSNVNTRSKTLVRTHQAFETYISMIFPDLAEQTAESAANADENNGTAEGENTSSARRRIFVM